MNSIFLKTLYDKRWFMLGWWLGFAALAALMVVFYPAMHQDGSLDKLLGSMPAALQGFVGDLANLKEFSTYLASQMFDIRMLLIGGVMVIILGLSLSVGEEDAGITRTLLSLPISRTKLLIQKWLAIAVIIAVTLTGAAAGILALQPTINEAVDLGALLRLLVMTWLVMVALATVTFAVAKASGSRGLATGIAILVVAGSFIITTFSKGVEWLQDFNFLSVFHYYPAVEIAKGTIELGDVAVLAVITLVSLAVAWVFFRSRDVA